MGTYEIETLKWSSLLSIARELVKAGCGYIDTSICYNNDYRLKDILKEFDFKIISKIPPQYIEYYDYVIDHHLKCLGRDKIDLMLIHNSRSEWVELAKKLESDNRFLEVGVSNFSIDDLKKYKSELGHYPRYNEIEINPRYPNHKLVHFCKANGIKIIAYAIFGGKYNSMKIISDFTLPQILNQIFLKADLAILRVDSIDQLLQAKSVPTWTPKEFLTYDTHTKSIEPMNYKKTMCNKLKFGDKVIHTYSKVMGVNQDLEVNCDNDDLSATIQNYINQLPYLEFITDYRAFIRYYLVDKLNARFKVRYIGDTLAVSNTVTMKTTLFNVVILENGELTKINRANQGLHVDIRLEQITVDTSDIEKYYE